MSDNLFEWVKEPQNPSLPITQQFDLLPVKTKIDLFKSVISAMVVEAQSLEVVDDESNRLAVAKASAAKRKYKDMEETRKQILSPHAEYTSAINRLFKDTQGPLGEIERILKTKISAYQTRIELERRKAEEAARLATLELQEKINQEAAANNVPPPQVVAPVLPEAPKVTRTEQGSASQVKTWTFEVIDPQAVPREYLVVDERLIRQAVKNGIREISGCRIFEKCETRIRT